ncbi:MAG: ABC transporter substrate-binding protein [Gemmatimonadetes bacterium]|nr:ABC transporter substrate-binding protein [Gemmatimonadota bacterium]
MKRSSSAARAKLQRAKRRTSALLPLLPLLPLLASACSRPDAIVVGSKNFTESMLLGEIVAQQLERYQLRVERKLYLGGTFVCHEAIKAGQIDVYVEYTGTAYSAILVLPATTDAAQVWRAVDSTYAARWDLAWTGPLGFNNTFAMLVRRRDAQRLGIRTLSQAVRYARTWRPAFGYEFVEREDGYQGSLKAYGRTFAARPAVMDLGLSYKALAEGRADIIAGNSTDGQVAALDLFQLEDDRHYFPPYEAAPVVRRDLFTRFPAARAALATLEGTITEEKMRQLNYQVDVVHRPAVQVAREFLATVPK